MRTQWEGEEPPRPVLPGAVDRAGIGGDDFRMDLVYDPMAAAALLRMPMKDAAALRRKLEAFAHDPAGAHPWAKSFGPGTGRIRHGDWRALYRIDKGKLVVFVVRIGNRREIYR